MSASNTVTKNDLKAILEELPFGSHGLGDWTAITLPHYVTEDSVVAVYLMPSNASSAYFMMNKEAGGLAFRLNSHSGFSEYGETTVKAGTQLTQSALSNGTVSIRIRPLHS